MSDNSKIEWTDASWNPIHARHKTTGKVGWHCEHVTTGCEFCYSEGFNKRLGTGLPFKPGHRVDIDFFLSDENLTLPLRWKRPRRIFVCSMTDLFADFVPDEWIDKMFAVMALCPQHTFQVLTKRAGRMRAYCRKFGAAAKVRDPAPTLARNPNAFLEFGWPLKNVWLGISCERQEEADERIPLLMQTPAAVRFISAEPLLGPINLNHIRLSTKIDGIWIDVLAGFGKSTGNEIDWVIVGGESGPHARPMHPDWARSLRDQCATAGIPFFFKQCGEWEPCERINVSKLHALCGVMAAEPKIERDWVKALNFLQKTRGVDGAHVLVRVGKKSAGRLLDGKEHNEFPLARTKAEAA